MGHVGSSRCARRPWGAPGRVRPRRVTGGSSSPNTGTIRHYSPSGDRDSRPGDPPARATGVPSRWRTRRRPSRRGAWSVGHARIRVQQCGGLACVRGQPQPGDRMVSGPWDRAGVVFVIRMPCSGRPVGTGDRVRWVSSRHDPPRDHRGPSFCRRPEGHRSARQRDGGRDPLCAGHSAGRRGVRRSAGRPGRGRCVVCGRHADRPGHAGLLDLVGDLRRAGRLHRLAVAALAADRDPAPADRLSGGWVHAAERGVAAGDQGRLDSDQRAGDPRAGRGAGSVDPADHHHAGQRRCRHRDRARARSASTWAG